MHSLKIIPVGNSLGCILPRELLAQLRLTKGDRLFLVEEAEGYRLTPYDEAFVQQMQAAEELLRSDRSLLRALND